MSVTVILAAAIYPQECIEKTIAAYADFCSVKLFPPTQHSCLAEITAAGSSDENQVVNEFLNYLLDLSVEKQLTIQ